MTEIELKLQVPPAVRQAVERALMAGGRSSVLRLQARYFDTPDRRLARAGMALRLRKEGRRWVQALKGAGDNPLQRLEHEVVLPAAAGAEPALDPTRHAGTQAGGRLASLLDGGEPLVELFRTDIRRRVRMARTAAGSVELALDLGEIRSGERWIPVAELEIELKRGSPTAVLDVARRWVRQHGLCPDLQTKAERGDRLARGETFAPPLKARPPGLADAMNERTAFARVAAVCVEQALANAGAIAAGSPQPEHLHQLRVGLRRLRTALRFFNGHAPEGLDERIAALFRRLGSTRDLDVLKESLMPALHAAGSPPVALPSETQGLESPAAVLAEPEVSLLWLDLIVLAQPPVTRHDGPPPDTGPLLAGGALPLEEWFGQRLERWHKLVRRDARRFDELDDAARHRLRRRAKRLRYAVEFGSSLYRPKAVEKYLARLRPAQDALGVLNDRVVATAMFDGLRDQDPRAWFALGWLRAERPRVLNDCSEALRGFLDAKPFWR